MSSQSPLRMLSSITSLPIFATDLLVILVSRYIYGMHMYRSVYFCLVLTIVFLQLPFTEEEACHTYTDIIKAIENAPDGNEMAEWRTELAPAIARGYWRLGENGTVLDMIYAIRADEAEHRDVNHVCSGIKEGQINPLFNPQDKFDEMLMTYAQTIMLKRDEGK